MSKQDLIIKINDIIKTQTPINKRSINKFIKEANGDKAILDLISKIVIKPKSRSKPVNIKLSKQIERFNKYKYKDVMYEDLDVIKNTTTRKDYYSSYDHEFSEAAKNWVQSYCNPAHAMEQITIPDGSIFPCVSLRLRMSQTISIKANEMMVFVLVPDPLCPLIYFINNDKPDIARCMEFSTFAKRSSVPTYQELEYNQYRIMAQGVTIKNNTNLNDAGGSIKAAKLQLDNTYYTDDATNITYNALHLPASQDALAAYPYKYETNAVEGVYMINNNYQPDYTLVDAEESTKPVVIALDGSTAPFIHVKNKNDQPARTISTCLNKTWGYGLIYVLSNRDTNVDIDCYMSFQAMVKPTSSQVAFTKIPTCIDYKALQFVSMFFQYNNTVFPSSYNDWNKIWSTIKNVFNKVKPLLKLGLPFLGDVIPEIKPLVPIADKILFSNSSKTNNGNEHFTNDEYNSSYGKM